MAKNDPAAGRASDLTRTTFHMANSVEAPMRVTGRDRSLTVVVTDAQARKLPIKLACVAPSPSDDYAIIDLALIATAATTTAGQDESAPEVGLRYSAFTPRQRGWFLAWQAAPLSPAPPAFQQLYLANLEVRLLEGGESANAAVVELQRLAASDAWIDNAGLWRVTVFAAWLRQDAATLVDCITSGRLPVELIGLALGMQSLLGAPITIAEVRQLSIGWSLPAADLIEAVLTFRLQSLGMASKGEPLAYALHQLGEDAHLPLPWRCQHRDLRIRLPQPDVRRSLEPLLTELTAVSSTDDAAAESPDSPAMEKSKAQEELTRAHIVLEFRQSRSEYFPFALRLAQKRAGFTQLLDEDRHLVYRVTFRKNEMNAFWQLWNYVQSWNATRLFCKGEELQKWQVYPYSQYLR